MFYGNAILTIFLAFSGVGRAGDGADSVHTEIIDTLTVLQAEQLLAERNAELRLSRLACTEAEAVGEEVFHFGTDDEAYACLGVAGVVAEGITSSVDSFSLFTKPS